MIKRTWLVKAPAMAAIRTVAVLLARDANANDSINNVTELFGSRTIGRFNVLRRFAANDNALVDRRARADSRSVKGRL